MSPGCRLRYRPRSARAERIRAVRRDQQGRLVERLLYVRVGEAREYGAAQLITRSA
jgi:hypothetical protein